MDFYRKKQREIERYDISKNPEDINEPKEEIDYGIFESRYGFGEQMQGYMEELDTIDVDIIGLKYGDGFTYKEISLILDMTEEAIRKRASRARKKLEIIIMEEK